jgi:hypothetical protein
MASLQELPTELLSQIFSYFEGDRKQLRILARECRCFSLAIRKILLSDVSLSSYDQYGPGNHRLELLNRTLTESPELVPMVRYIAVAWSSTSMELQDLNDRFLGRLTALRALKMQNTTVRINLSMF